MKRLITDAIVLHRINYGEADRILTVMTPDHGKLSLIAKGVRREKSKLAGGVELFSISEIGFIPGRGEVSTLTSSRLKRHMSKITSNLEKTMFGYDLLKIVHKATESQAESAYFHLLAEIFEGLQNTELSLPIIQSWFNLRLLAISGHAPNLKTDTNDKLLDKNGTYAFNMQEVAFEPHGNGPYAAAHITLMRVLLSHSLQSFIRIQARESTVQDVCTLSGSLRDYYVRTG